MRFTSPGVCERVDELGIFRGGYIYSEHSNLLHIHQKKKIALEIAA